MGDNIIQLMVDSESNIRNYWSRTPVVGLCKSRNSYCWTRSKPKQYLSRLLQSPTTGVEAPIIPDVGQGSNHQLYYYYISL